jgi:hypothetical protein
LLPSLVDSTNRPCDRFLTDAVPPIDPAR